MNPRPSATSRVRAVRRLRGSLGALGCFDDGTERRGIPDGQVSQDLAIEVDARALEAAHQLAVRDAVLSGCGVDADDPQLAHLALPLLAVARRVRERVEQRFARRLDQPRLGALAALGGLQEALVSLVG